MHQNFVLIVTIANGTTGLQSNFIKKCFSKIVLHFTNTHRNNGHQVSLKMSLENNVQNASTQRMLNVALPKYGFKIILKFIKRMKQPYQQSCLLLRCSR